MTRSQNNFYNISPYYIPIFLKKRRETYHQGLETLKGAFGRELV